MKDTVVTPTHNHWVLRSCLHPLLLNTSQTRPATSTGQPQRQKARAHLSRYTTICSGFHCGPDTQNQSDRGLSSSKWRERGEGGGEEGVEECQRKYKLWQTQWGTRDSSSRNVSRRIETQTANLMRQSFLYRHETGVHVLTCSRWTHAHTAGHYQKKTTVWPHTWPPCSFVVILQKNF